MGGNRRIPDVEILAFPLLSGASGQYRAIWQYMKRALCAAISYAFVEQWAGILNLSTHISRRRRRYIEYKPSWFRFLEVDRWQISFRRRGMMLLLLLLLQELLLLLQQLGLLLFGEMRPCGCDQRLCAADSGSDDGADQRAEFLGDGNAVARRRIPGRLRAPIRPL